MRESITFFERFLAAFEFRPTAFDELDPEKIISIIQKYVEHGIKYVEITDNYGGMPALPGIYVADLIGPLMVKIVRLNIFDRSPTVITSDIAHMISVGAESVMLTFGEKGVSFPAGFEEYSQIAFLEDKEVLKEHILIGAEVRIAQITEDNIVMLKRMGVDYIQTEPIFCGDQMYKVMEVVHKEEMSLMVGISYPRNKYGLHQGMSEAYLKSFEDIAHEGVFLSTAIAQAVGLIKLCQANVEGVHIMASPEHVGYFRDVITDVRGKRISKDI